MALLGCPRRAEKVREIHGTTQGRLADDRRVDDRGRGRSVLGGADMDVTPEIVERRQRAREAFYDRVDMGGLGHVSQGLDEALETATRVQITPQIVVAFEDLDNERCCDCGIKTAAGLAGVFRAAGFEVEE